MSVDTRALKLTNLKFYSSLLLLKKPKKEVSMKGIIFWFFLITSPTSAFGFFNYHIVYPNPSNLYFPVPTPPSWWEIQVWYPTGLYSESITIFESPGIWYPINTWYPQNILFVENIGHILGVWYPRGLQPPVSFVIPVHEFNTAPLLFTQAANGNAFSQFQLGQMYEQGILLTPNLGAAIYWYKRAAEQGYIPAWQALQKY